MFNIKLHIKNKITSAMTIFRGIPKLSDINIPEIKGIRILINGILFNTLRSVNTLNTVIPRDILKGFRSFNYK